MNKLLLLLLISSIAISQSKDVVIEDAIIVWKKSQRLEWKDFAGEMDADVFGTAKTVYKIEIVPIEVYVDENDNIQNIEQLSVIAHFYKNLSWTASRNVALLAHEQLHFDIAELYARKIRKRFSEMKNIQEFRFSQFQTEYSKLMNACKSFQKKYDKETKHGSIININNQWIKTIKNSLRELEDYS